jgi:spore germination protein GerM
LQKDMPDTAKPPRKRRRKKSGKYTPLIWILTGAVIAFFISYSNSLKDLPVFNEKNNTAPRPAVNTNSFQFPKIGFPSVKPGKPKAESGNITVKLYLATQTGNDMTFAEKDVEIPKSPGTLKDTLEALIRTKDDNLQNLVPMNTKIRKVWIQDEIAYIDFSEDFSYNSYGLIGYKIQIYQVVYTATQFEGVRAVYFYMEGKPLKYLGGDGYPLNNPVYPYSSLPKFPL